MMRANSLLMPFPKRIVIALMAITTAYFCMFTTFAIAQDNESAHATNSQTLETQLEEILSFLKDDGFVYSREGRPDPFQPFITEQMIRAEKSKAVKSLEGLQLLEPGQLRLVAIILSGNKPLAMAEDSVGKGYIIRKGMQIGLSSVVEDIVPNAVLIKQKYKTISGKTQYRKIEMVLKKEGEK